MLALPRRPHTLEKKAFFRLLLSSNNMKLTADVAFFGAAH